MVAGLTWGKGTNVPLLQDLYFNSPVECRITCSGSLHHPAGIHTGLDCLYYSSQKTLQCFKVSLIMLTWNAHSYFEMEGESQELKICKLTQFIAALGEKQWGEAS